MNFLNDYEFYENINIKKYNSYKLNVICKYLVFIKNIDELVSLIEYLKENNINYLILGNGTNVIFSKDYFDGVIIKLDKLNNLKVNNTEVYVECGYPLVKLSKEIFKYGLVGLEFASGIPGLLGASVAMNAGAYNKDMASVVKEVTILNDKLEIVKLTNKDLSFEYRNSILKKHKDYICLSAVLSLEYGDINQSKQLIEERRTRRLETQPLDYPSAGSVFRNPDNMHAGELIEKCNLKGYNINGAEVSVKHANFIINTGNCSGEDIIKLIEIIKKEVFSKYNIELILEQIII